MNNTDKRYLYFYVKNYSGTFSTSGYTLPISPFTFIPVLDDAVDANISNTSIYWDFGDGTISRDITATHYYTIPGIYNVSCFFLANSGKGFESTFKQSISVKDYYSDTLILSADTDIVNSASHTDTTLLLSRINSWQSYDVNNNYSVMLYASGEGAPLLDIESYKRDKFAHLKPNSRFLSYVYNTATDSYELIPVSNINTNNELLYVYLSGSVIVPCTSTTVGAVLAGTSGQQVFYFTDDNPSKLITVAAYFDSRIFKDKDYKPIVSQYPILHQSNTATYSLSFDNNQIPNYLSITSNGVDGEQTQITSFKIAAEKYTNQTISFVVKVKDGSNYSIKSINNLALIKQNVSLTEGKIKVNLIDSSNNILPDVTVEANFGVLADETYGGYFRGMVKSAKPYSNVRLHARALVKGVEITGTSNVFSIYDTGVYSIGKVNENFDASRQIQSYVFQDSFQDYHNALNNFIGTAVGDINSSPTYLGKRIYERIANFTSNVADVDTCTLEALRSMYELLGEDFFAFHRFNFNYPAAISRLVELFSVKFTKLRGSRNLYSQYFLNKGYSSIDVKYGKNRGKELDIFTTILTAGSASKPIVAYEKFSEQYTLLNTNVLSSAYTQYINPLTMTYPLSTFNKWWGWELVLPDTYTIYDISKYYKFYEYVDGQDGTQLEGVINWGDDLTTIDEKLSSVSGWDSIRESMLTYALINAMILSGS